jgi:DNA-binding MarR family transcriptional regulator
MSTVPSPAETGARPQPPRELRRSTTFLLKRLGWLVKERSLAAFGATGMNPQHFGVLSLLEEGARETQATIADALGIDRSQLVGLLDQLEERGLVERRRDPNDRRRQMVSLTASGHRQLAKLRKMVRRFEDEILAPLNAAERATLHELLLKTAAHRDRRYAVAT